MKLKEIEKEENESEIETAKRKLKEIEEVESDSESECDYKKQMRKQMEDEEELEGVFMKLNSWKMNCGESLFKNSKLLVIYLNVASVLEVNLLWI